MNTVAKPENFESRMKDRIKESIGDLITDEELSAMIKRGIEEAFFTPITTRKTYGPDEHTPALIHTIIKECLLEQVNTFVNQWMKDNPEAVSEAIKTVVTNGAGNAILASLTNKFEIDFINMQHNIVNTLQNN